MRRERIWVATADARRLMLCDHEALLPHEGPGQPGTLAAGLDFVVSPS